MFNLNSRFLTVNEFRIKQINKDDSNKYLKSNNNVSMLLNQESINNNYYVNNKKYKYIFDNDNIKVNSKYSNNLSKIKTKEIAKNNNVVNSTKTINNKKYKNTDNNFIFKYSKEISPNKKLIKFTSLIPKNKNNNNKIILKNRSIINKDLNIRNVNKLFRIYKNIPKRYIDSKKVNQIYYDSNNSVYNIETINKYSDNIYKTTSNNQINLDNNFFQNKIMNKELLFEPYLIQNKYNFFENYRTYLKNNKHIFNSVMDIYTKKQVKNYVTKSKDIKSGLKLINNSKSNFCLNNSKLKFNDSSKFILENFQYDDNINKNLNIYKSSNELIKKSYIPTNICKIDSGSLNLSRESMLKNLELKATNILNYKIRPCSRSSFSMVNFKNLIFIFGGISTERLSDMWVCDIKNKFTWTKLFPNGVEINARSGHTAVIYNNLMYIFGGSYNKYISLTIEDIVLYDFSKKYFLLMFKYSQ